MAGQPVGMVVKATESHMADCVVRVPSPKLAT